MLNNTQINSMIDIVTGMGLVDIKDQESLIDGNSVALLTAKVNAITLILLKDKPQEVKDEFIQMWKTEYQDLISRKHNMIFKVIDRPEMTSAMGLDESDMINFKEQLVEQMNDMKDLIKKGTDSVIQSIDTYVI
jgi:hypothetical protein